MIANKIFAATLIALLTTTSAYAADIVKIGVFEPITGVNAFAGQMEVEGIRLAHKEKPEVLGMKVELVVVDNKSDKVEAAMAVAHLVNRDKVNAIIGSYASSLSMAGNELAEMRKIPVVAASATSPKLTKDKKYCFRACFTDSSYGAGAAAYAMRKRGFKKAAILQDVVSEYSMTLARSFETTFNLLGGEVISKLMYQAGDQDFTAQLTEILSQNPDVLYLPSYYAEGALILEQARKLNAHLPIIGGDAMDNPDIKTLGGSIVSGLTLTSFSYAPSMPVMSASAQKFTDAWRAAYPGKEPSAISALAYTSYMMIMHAIESQGSAAPADITKGLADLREFTTPLGVISMDANHNSNMSVGIIEFKGATREYIGEISLTP